MMKRYLLALLALLLLVTGCQSTPPPEKEEPEEEVEIIEFAYVLEEIEPEPLKEVKPVVVEKVYYYINSSVTEVEVVDGEQKYFYLMIGYNKKGITNGLAGKIFNDIEKKEFIGTFKLIEVGDTYSKAVITELNYKLNPNATVEFKLEE